MTPVIRSNVTAFHQGPQDLQGGSFVFDRTAEQQNNLEHQSYEKLVQAQLERLGFRPAPSAAAAQLKVRMEYSVNGRDVRVVQPVVVDPWASPFYGPYWRGYYGGYYGRFYDPFWYGPGYVTQQESRYVLYQRQLKIMMSRASDGRNLYQVTVNSEGTNGALAAVMPYMVRSAFADFPGESGVPRQVDLKMEK